MLMCLFKGAPGIRGSPGLPGSPGVEVRGVTLNRTFPCILQGYNLFSLCQGQRGPDGYKGEQGRPGVSVGGSKSTFVAELLFLAISDTSLFHLSVVLQCVCSNRVRGVYLGYLEQQENPERRLVTFDGNTQLLILTDSTVAAHCQCL